MELDNDELMATRKLNGADRKRTIVLKNNVVCVLPSNWHIKLYDQDENFDELINCANCGTQLEYGDSYKSHDIISDNKKHYCICEKCCNDEWIKHNQD